MLEGKTEIDTVTENNANSQANSKRMVEAKTINRGNESRDVYTL